MSIDEIIEQIVEQKLAEKLPEMLKSFAASGKVNHKLYLSEKEACFRYQIARTALFNARSKGLISYRQDGRSIRYAVADIEAFIAKNQKLRPLRQRAG